METKRTYEDIEPFCKWRKDEASEVLEVHIQGFKKEDLRVQLNHAGFLVVTGERVVDHTKGVRFRKETKLPQDCITNDIRAKLTGGVLYITMPKKTLLSTKSQNVPDHQQNQEPSTGKPKLDEMLGPIDKRRRYLCVQMDPKMALKLGALTAVAVVVSVGAYIAYKYHKSYYGDNN